VSTNDFQIWHFMRPIDRHSFAATQLRESHDNNVASTRSKTLLGL